LDDLPVNRHPIGAVQREAYAWRGICTIHLVQS
jgi:hypothetical protein